MQLSTYVTLRGGRTLVGPCYEKGSLSLPYLAFVEALRSYVLSREVKDLREELGSGAADVARIISEIRERLKIKLRPQKDPEEERYPLLQAVTSFLFNAAAVQPMMVVREDLHDADKGTLEMLTHVSRNLAGARLLIVGTYRDVELDRTHPLSAALAVPESTRKPVPIATVRTLEETTAVEPKSVAIVSLAVTPWGEVYLDGRMQGVSQPLMELHVAPGKHEIEIRYTTFPVYIEKLQLKANEKIKIKYKFTN